MIYDLARTVVNNMARTLGIPVYALSAVLASVGLFFCARRPLSTTAFAAGSYGLFSWLQPVVQALQNGEDTLMRILAAAVSQVDRMLGGALSALGKMAEEVLAGMGLDLDTVTRWVFRIVVALVTLRLLRMI